MRVSLRTKRIKATEFKCNRCSEPIKVGEQYFEWKHNHAPVSRRHAQHGRPRTSELCTGKMSGVYAATEALEDAIAAGRASDDISGLEDALNECASSVREVAEEYENNVSNMPDSLQSSPTAEDMQEKASQLNEFADALESAASELDTDIEDEPEQTLDDCTDDCAISQADLSQEYGPADVECSCGYEEQKEAHEAWETETADKREEAFNVAENALQELSI
jgi:hypothetical protein